MIHTLQIVLLLNDTHDLTDAKSSITLRRSYLISHHCFELSQLEASNLNCFIEKQVKINTYYTKGFLEILIGQLSL